MGWLHCEAKEENFTIIHQRMISVFPETILRLRKKQKKQASGMKKEREVSTEHENELCSNPFWWL